MAEILGLGVTHSPPLCGIDSRMAAITERVLQSPRLPDHMRDPAAWPAPMRHEWEEHRAGRAARSALDAFNPDFVLIFGDDQYENFREDGVAPFCVFALDEPDWVDMAETYIFAAPKAFAVFNPPLARAAE